MFLSGSQIFVLRKKKRSIRNKKSIVEEKTMGDGRWEMGRKSRSLKAASPTQMTAQARREEDERQIKILSKWGSN